MLSKRQTTALNKIKQAFDNGDSIIHLHGPAGGGKTTLIKYLLQTEMAEFEDCSLYYIEGKRDTVGSYETITLAEGIRRPNHEFTGFNLSLGFKISSLFNLGVAGVFQKKPALDPKVNFVVEELKRKSTSQILIVADSFQYWDVASKNFLLTLNNYREKLLGQKRLCVVIITDDDAKQISDYIDLSTLYARGLEIVFPLPSRLELRSILYLLGYSELRISDDDLDKIISITGGNLDFIKFFIEGYYYSKQSKLSTDTSLFDVMKMLEHRLEVFGDKKDDLSEVLQASSILNGDFKAEQIEYLLNHKKNVEDLLQESCEHAILKESNHYIFSNTFIQELFYKKLKKSKKEIKFSIEYANYLKEREPENYTGRAYYLSVGDPNNERILEVLELFTMAYCRNIESSIEDAESKKIEVLIKEKAQSSLDRHDVKRQYTLFLNLKNAYELYFQERYREASQVLDQVPLLGTSLIMSEIERMKLVVALMVNIHTDKIRRLTERLHEILNELKSHEKEQWCKIAFTLFSTYSNKLGDFDQSERIVNELLAYINNYKGGHGYYEYLGNVIARKACVFKQASLAVFNTADSLEYFSNRSDYLQYYLTLCNHSGNLLVLGKYDEAINHLTKCLELVTEHPLVQFPSQEKVYNNLILSKFFNKYNIKEYENQLYISEAIQEFEKKVSDVSRESNAIIHINMINLYLMKGDYQTSHEMLDVLTNKILKDTEDSFYQYYVLNLNLVLCVLQHSWEEAEKYCSRMKDNFPSFHKKNKLLIQQRNVALQKLIEHKASHPSNQLDEWIYQNANPLDEAGGFYCRLFLFSDLQFTSI